MSVIVIQFITLAGTGRPVLRADER
ncbi:MAG: hypothetical protein JWP48_1226, partial [Actinoallomurus sp.]|nr:hypothetical protein [Actinoallomurus sp.]